MRGKGLIFFSVLILAICGIGAMSPNINDREYEKFVEDASGKTSIRAKITGNITVADDQWMGIGAAEGRIEFDNQTTDEVNILNANVGIGTSTPTSNAGGLDIASGGLGLILGADSAASTRTANTEKLARFGFAHYDNAKQPITGMYMISTQTLNSLSIGGGTATMNAATNIDFFTAPNNITTTGTQRMRITSAGVVNINGTAGTAPSLIVTMPGTQTLVNETIITADACGTLKRLTSATVVITNTTNTFTTPAAGNAGCCMDVVNVGASVITLDYNANFVSAGAADVLLGAGDTVRVSSDGTDWYQVGATGNN